MKPSLITFLQVVSRTASFFEIQYVDVTRLGQKVFATFYAQRPATADLLGKMAAYWTVQVEMRARGADLDVTLWSDFETDDLAMLQDYAKTVNAVLFDRVVHPVNRPFAGNP